MNRLQNLIARSWLMTGLLAVVLFSGCTKKTAQVARPAFSADSAYQFIEAQMQFGPRVPNSQGHTYCAAYILQTMQRYGAIVELQKGEMIDYSGRPQMVLNLIAHFNTPETSVHPRVLLGAHYDTRPWCDEEELYADRYMNVPGANDGASGVGVLMEVGRQLGLKMADSTLQTPVDLVFFDCEDMGTPRFYTGAEREDTWCLGSQLWATRYALNKMPSYQYGILLDMVGAPDAVFPRELYSQQYAANYQERIWRVASNLGYGAHFVNENAYPIVDDHLYVNRIAGIPMVDIIHYDARNQTGFPAWWHTRQDNMDNISRATLQAVGEVVMKVIE